MTEKPREDEDPKTIEPRLPRRTPDGEGPIDTPLERPGERAERPPTV